MGIYQEKYQKVLKACQNAKYAGSNPHNKKPKVVVVTKNQSIAAIKEAYDLGILDFGENRVEVLEEKRSCLPQDINWHFLGNIQSKKLTKILKNSTFIHSVSTLEIAKKILIKSQENPSFHFPQFFLQVNTSFEESKQGIYFDNAFSVASEIILFEKELIRCYSTNSSRKKTQFMGLMTMAPKTEEESTIRQTFSRLFSLRSQLSEAFPENLLELSMGMSRDYQIALEEGSNYLRIGTYFFK